MESSESISSIVKRGAKYAYEEILLEGYAKADKENREEIQKAREEAQKIREEQKATTKRNVVKSYNCGLQLQQISEIFDLSEEKVLGILKGEGLIK